MTGSTTGEGAGKVGDEVGEVAEAAAAAASWIGRRAHPLTTFDPGAPTADLRPLAGIVRDARVVALGTSTRQSHELSVLSHRMVRFLVEELGFRSLALEGDDPVRLGLDAYLATGAGDPRAMLAGARPFWRTEEILGLVRWMRAFNRRHPGDQVRFAGSVGDPRRPDFRPGDPAGLESALAEDVLRSHEGTGERIVWWGGIAHTADGRPRTVSSSGFAPATHRSAGGHLREHFGSGYVSLGQLFHHGTAPYPLPAPPADFAEAVLGAAGPDAYLLDLRADSPAAVRTWLDARTRTRLLGPHYDPADDAGHHLSGGSLAGWFDAVVFTREVTPVRLLPDADTDTDAGADPGTDADTWGGERRAGHHPA
ncbi:erythromycin esterase family protein [Streptomyces sp. NPDC048718]|uniref:erythromycin esterase family protein n=1 Tax=Streptomyces sp. NPDC048718 TaxID=3365587 RepID=UPI0037227280